MPRVLVIDDGRAAHFARWQQIIKQDAAYAQLVANYVRRFPDVIVSRVHDSFEVDAIKLASNGEARTALAEILGYLLTVDANDKLCYDVETIPTMEAKWPQNLTAIKS